MLQSDKNMKWGSLCFNGTCFTVGIARTIFQKSRGLKHVRELKKTEGMLFIFKTNLPKFFWMKGVLIPLDIIWLDKNFKIVDIHKNQQPCENFFCPILYPKKKARYVFEVNGGTADRLNLEESMRAEVTLP